MRKRESEDNEIKEQLRIYINDDNNDNDDNDDDDDDCQDQHRDKSYGYV